MVRISQAWRNPSGSEGCYSPSLSCSHLDPCFITALMRRRNYLVCEFVLFFFTQCFIIWSYCWWTGLCVTLSPLVAWNVCSVLPVPGLGRAWMGFQHPASHTSSVHIKQSTRALARMFFRHNFFSAVCAEYCVKAGEVSSLHLCPYPVNYIGGSKISN